MSVASPERPLASVTGSPTQLQYAQRVRAHRRSRNHWLTTVQRTFASPMGRVGGLLLATVVLATAFANLICPYDPIAQHAGQELLRPGGQFLLGTDQLGRDVLSRVVYGSRTSLIVGVLAVAMGAGAGTLTGLLAGYFGGWVERVIMRWYDALMAFPAILLGIAVVTVLGNGMLSVAYALAFGSVPVFARLARSTVLSERNKDYVLAARCTGATNGRIMLLHVLPNAILPLIVALSLSMGFAVLAESGLSFLGLGTQPPNPSWGAMLADSRAYLQRAPWLGVFPGLALALLLLSLNCVSDALRDALDPRRINR